MPRFSLVRLLFFFSLIAGATAFTERAAADTDVEFILDISGSMQQKLGGEAQIDSARKALMSALNEIQPSQLVALRVYGHRVDQTKKEESCKDTELLVPFKELDKSEIKGKIDGLVPKGYTPIAFSLEQSRNDLLDVGIGREAERVIILMTDGEETCGGDALAVLKKLKEEGFRLTVYTVGFNVNDVARKQLEDIAQFTGGKYFDAKSAKELSSALSEATKESVVLLDKKKSTYGTVIRGGDSYETAVPLPLDTEYRLDHHQKMGDYDYFSIDVKRGDEVTLRVATLERGAYFDSDGKFRETDNPYMGLEVHDASRSKQKEVQIIGSRSKVETAVFRPKADGKYFVLLGSVYAAIHKDQATFKLTLEHKGDLGTDNDAGDGMDTALPVQAQRYAKNFIGDADQIDTFSLEAKKGERYVLGVVPNNQGTEWFSLRVYDDFKQEVYSKSSGSNSGLKSDEIEIPDDGTFFIELKYPHETAMDYALVIKKKDSTATEKGGDASAGNPAQ